MKTIASMIRQLSGLLGTKDLNDCEQGFIRALAEQLDIEGSSTALTDKQVEKIEEIYSKHFSG